MRDGRQVGAAKAGVGGLDVLLDLRDGVRLDLRPDDLLAVLHQPLAGEAGVSGQLVQHGFHLAHLIDDRDLREGTVLGGLKFVLRPLEYLHLVLCVGKVLVRFRRRIQPVNERAQAAAKLGQV